VLRLPDTVVTEHISRGTGGTCFSLTEAAREILESSGIGTRQVMADMQHGPSIHCAALTELPGGMTYLVDPGYLVPEPVLLEPDRTTEVHCGAETLEYRPVPGDESWDMFTVTEKGSSWRYRIRLAPVTREKFTRSWTDSFDAPGMNSLHINMRTGGNRLYAHNHNLRITAAGGGRNQKLRDDYAGRIEEIFGISRSVAARAWEELERSRCR
jgi:arylamine N-acetyltransferase